ncbi:MAG: MFS transporter [Patescibacteria group bacterium]|nr:MFS transporter [Patescibacteria group bacterium]
MPPTLRRGRNSVMNKRNLWLWSLYDFANSVVFINFILYFSQWLVIDGGLSDFWYNAIFAITTILLLASAPLLAAYTDRYGGNKLFLNLATIGTAISYALAVFFAYAGMSILPIALLFLAGQYFYQFSFVFYNAMIADIAEEDKRTRASGIGYFANFLGQISGLAIFLPIAGSRLAPLVPSVAIFFILALPMMIFFKETNSAKSSVARLRNIRGETMIFFRKFILFISASVSVPMLIAYFLFNDALITLTNNYGIYLERVFATPDAQKSFLLMAFLVMCMVGSGVSAWIGDRFSASSQLKLTLAAGTLVIPLVAIAPSFEVFALLTVPMGFIVGAIFSVSRSYMSMLLSPQDMTYGFAFYTLAERFATFLGPLMWGSIIAVMGIDSTAYRTAVASLTVFVLAGLLILVFFRRDTARSVVG